MKTSVLILLTAALWQESAAATANNNIKIAPSPLSARLPLRLLARQRRRQLQANNNNNNNNNESTPTITSATGTSCSGDPFLWLIQKDNNSTKETVGFAMGTMHVPRELALSGDDAFQSLLHALEDACTVYAELDLTDPKIMEEATECVLEVQTSNAGTLATIADIPDPDLRARYEAVLLTIVEEYAAELGPANQVATQLAQTFSLDDIVSMVQAYNTPEYKNSFFEQSFNPNADASFLDTDLLDEARSTASLETVAAQCNLIEQLTTNKDDFLENYETQFAPALAVALEVPSQLSGLFSAYQCGSVDRVREVLAAGEAITETPEAFMTALLDGKKEQCIFSIFVVFRFTGITQD